MIILVVEDEEPIAKILQFTLEREGYTVQVAGDGEAALRLIKRSEPHLILLDIMLPKLDGFEVCREVRASSTVPIIMLTARNAEVDKVLGLELGADDYVTKPFSTRELLARVKANLRRMVHDEEDRSSNRGRDRIVLDDLVIDFNFYAVTKSGENIPLTHREFELLAFLATRPGMVFTRDELLVQVWGNQYAGDDRTVDVTVRRLREKLEADPSNPKYVLTRRGVGYYARR